MEAYQHLSEEELEGCKATFEAFDEDGSGTIDVFELKSVLEALVQTPSEDDVFNMISEVGEMGGELDFQDFVRLIIYQKHRAGKCAANESDCLDAFVACGGNADKSGYIEKGNLSRIISQDFGINFDLNKIYGTTLNDAQTKISFEQFKLIFTN